MIVDEEEGFNLSSPEAIEHDCKSGKILILGGNQFAPIVSGLLFDILPIRAMQPENGEIGNEVLMFFEDIENGGHVIAMQKDMSQVSLVQELEISGSQIIRISCLHGISESFRQPAGEFTE